MHEGRDVREGRVTFWAKVGKMGLGKTGVCKTGVCKRYQFATTIL